MFKGISELLRDVLEREGHGSIEQMARYYSRKFGEDIPAGTLYSYMTKKKAHRRRPREPTHIRWVSKILRMSPTKVLEIMEEEDARAGKGKGNRR